ncbi:alpha/beta hydrolase family protein [Flavobacterium sp. UBA7682]|uniref:alpha/beta hydrolase family protein n=1 Tax=Flavobacterium sp. UBA7682 TaxID=1946560 RepID=UPI0025BE4AC4|nr:prolyl oligopeptidase family serine peptidase [Flavobacterium sp. UBA7682]
MMMVSLLQAVPSFGQNKTKKQLTVADYAKWSRLVDEKIAADGKWVSYKLNYDYGADTLFVQQRQGKKRTAFPEAEEGSFSKDGKYLAVVEKEGKLSIRDLANNRETTYLDVIDYEFTEKDLAIVSKTEKEQTLTVFNLDTGKENVFDDCSEWAISKDGKIAMVSKQAVQYYHKGTTTKLPFSDAGYRKLTWNDEANAICFLEPMAKANDMASFKIYHYNLESQKTTVLNPFESEVLKGQVIFGEGNAALRFSNDGRQVFFNYSEPKKKEVKQPFEVWDTDTPYEYGWNKLYGDPKPLNKVASWFPSENKVVLIGTNERPNAMLTIDGKYAVCYDLKQYEPQYGHVAPADMYLKNMESGEEKLWLTKHTTAPGMTGASPKGNYLYYYKERNWWIYDIRKGIHHNLTAAIPIAVTDHQRYEAGPPYPFASPGWSADEKYFIVYDHYDMWLINSIDYSARRITRGKEANVQFRVCEELYPLARKLYKDEYLVRDIDFSKGLLLYGRSDNGKSGYYKMNPDFSVSKLLFSNSGKSNVQKAAHTEDYIFVEETAVSPPKLMHFKGSQPVKTVFQSNPLAKNYSWGEAELIAYQNKQGVPLKGILYKPTDYVPGQQYPMVVFIYEKQSPGFHNYIVPTEFDSVGFNAAHYFLNGYLVLFPDIVYTPGEVGLSALDCVVAAVEKVKSMGIVEENSIGLIGHSFGGYESAFIITQTKLFKAAVSASGTTNTISGYLSYSTPARRPDAWRYESQQHRYGFSPFENWEAYSKNSALHHVAQCETPLLSWAGKKDTSVLWTQGSEFHMALRRLGKKNLFIVYENEGHTIKDSKLQKDLTMKIKEWFDFYLKEKAK